MYYQFGVVLVFIVFALAFIFGSLCLGSFVRRRVYSPNKHAVYECGEPSIGSSWIRYNSRFYNVALVYLLFDVEVVLLIPVVLVVKERAADGLALVPLIAIISFLFLLALGLAYEWFYGNLDWIHKEHTLANDEK